MIVKHVVPILILAIFSTGCATPGGEKRHVSIEVHAASELKTDTLSATAFGVALAASLSKEGNVDLQPVGYYKPTFSILVSAFSSQIQIWREIREKEDPKSPYMNQLIEIDNAGFLKEYVSVEHSNVVVDEIPKNIRIDQFLKWSKENLMNHKPRIEARLRLQD